jgi:hypothetical protein
VCGLRAVIIRKNNWLIKDEKVAAETGCIIEFRLLPQPENSIVGFSVHLQQMKFISK